MDIDDPARIGELRALIERKPALRAFMSETYHRYVDCLARAPEDGLVLELGSGAGFAREFIPDIIISDVLAYDATSNVVDAMALPFAAQSLRAVLLLNVLHHIPDVGRFFNELVRCLVPGGRVLIVDQHVGYISAPILKYVHHEPFDAGAKTWSFATTGPLSGANGALAWIVFQRDREQFKQQFPQLEIVGYKPHTPLRYWLAGGLKSWSLSPAWTLPLLRAVDRLLACLAPNLGSFVDIELCRVNECPNSP